MSMKETELKISAEDTKIKFSTKQILKFVIPSLIGLFLFVIPLPWGGGSITIGVGYLASLFSSSYGSFLPDFMVYVVVTSAALTLIANVIKPKFIMKTKYLKELFVVKPLMLAIRIVAAIFAVAVLFELSSFGLDKVSNPNTGGVVINDLFPVLATWFLFSGFFYLYLWNLVLWITWGL